MMVVATKFRLLWLLLLKFCAGRKHELTLTDDYRLVIDLSSFAYNEHGYLTANFDSFKLDAKNIETLLKNKNEDFEEMWKGTLPQMGFILERLNSRGAIKYQKTPGEVQTQKCALHEKGEQNGTQVIGIKFGDAQNPSANENNEQYLTFTYSDLKSQGLTLTIEDNFDQDKATKEDPDETRRRKRRFTVDGDPADTVSNEQLGIETAANSKEHEISRGIDTDSDSSDGKLIKVIKEQNIYSYTFKLSWEFDEKAVGLYELSFHNCFNRNNEILAIDTLSMKLVEMNGEHYLSTGEIPLPMVYGVVSFLFFLATFVWLGVLRRKDTTVYKIHYLMLFLVFFKALSVMFHAIDFRFLDIEGQTDAWTIIFYIVHLLKGGILIVTLTLIGTGWAFIKYVLSDKEKRLFAIVVPLQIFVNVAFIIFKETEEGQKEYTSWSHALILLDLLCYALILWPVFWSIKHLQQASLTDGKAARNLAKLDLFRHFYIMFVLYIYFTRIVVYIMNITLPAHLTWVANFSDEIATLGFFLMTGFKFRPGCNNPYFKVEDEMSEVVTKSGLTENITRRDKGEKQKLLDNTDDEDEDTILDANTLVIA